MSPSDGRCMVRLDAMHGNARVRQAGRPQRQALHEEFTEGLELKASADVPAPGLHADSLINCKFG